MLPRPLALLVKQPHSAGAEVLERGLRSVGYEVVCLPTVFDAIPEAARSGGEVQYLLVGVDYLGPEAFRVLPIFRREWPQVTIVAYHSEGFEHKGRVAALVGADVVVSRPEEVHYFLETLPKPGPGPEVGRGVEREAEPTGPARPAGEVRPEPEAPQPAVEEPTPLAEEPPRELVDMLAREGGPAGVSHRDRPPRTRAAVEAPARSAPTGIGEEGGGPSPRAEPAGTPAAPVETGAEAGRSPPEGGGRSPRPEAAIGAAGAAVPASERSAAEAAEEPPVRPPAPSEAAALAALASGRPRTGSKAPVTRPAADGDESAAPPEPAEIENLDGDESLAEGRVIGTVELTDEELRILLGEDDDE